MLPPEVIQQLKLTSTVGGRRRRTLPELVVGWLLFAVALGVGVLIGWAIWG
jgi:hypothetical protein